MNARLAALLLLGNLTLAAQAADPVVTAANPASVVSALTAAGYSATLLTANDGDPEIRFTSANNAYLLFFMNCEKHLNCTELSYLARWSTVKGITPAQINTKWAQPYVSSLVVFIDTDGALAAETTLWTEPGGLPPGVFAANVRAWINATANAYTHIVDGR